MTYLTSRSNLLPYAFKREIFWKVDFLNTVEAKVIILTWYVKTNEAMAINKFQRSRLTFDLSAKFAHIGVPSTYLNIVFSETTWQIEIKIHMTTPYDWLAKICTNCYGHMTKMATKPIYGKKYLLWNQNANGLGTYFVALNMWSLPEASSIMRVLAERSLIGTYLYS